MNSRSLGSYATLLALLLLPACTTGAPAPAGVDVTGTWTGDWSVPGADSGTVEMRLQQNDGKVTGTLRVTGSAAGDPSGRLEGVVAGTVFRFSLPADPLTGNLTADGDVMTGTGNRNVLWYFTLRRQR